jgi:type I restriction-modification system DNA methylase subunit
MKYDKEGKAEYLSWLDKQKNVLISEAVKNWFMSTDWNWDRRYILVEDNKTLLFLHMRNADVLGKVYEYVLSDK